MLQYCKLIADLEKNEIKLQNSDETKVEISEEYQKLLKSFIEEYPA